MRSKERRGGVRRKGEQESYEAAACGSDPTPAPGQRDPGSSADERWQSSRPDAVAPTRPGVGAAPAGAPLWPTPPATRGGITASGHDDIATLRGLVGPCGSD
ncbi:unnamed protein product [Lampetra planeri]